MTELELAIWRDKTYNRLVEQLDMSHDQANFVIALEQHNHSSLGNHSALGDALQSINHFLDYIGY
jgi:hypothetical protein